MQILNTIGLCFNIFGVIILIFYSYPQPNFEEGSGLGLEDNSILKNGKTAKEDNTIKEQIKNKFKFLSKIALSFICIGFILQLIATWL